MGIVLLIFGLGMLLLFVKIVQFFIRAFTPSVSVEKVMEQIPKQQMEGHCIYCGTKIRMADTDHTSKYIGFDTGNLLSFWRDGFLFPFCLNHDPVNVPNTLPSETDRLLREERAHFEKRDRDRVNGTHQESKANQLAGQVVGLALGGGPVGAALTGAAAGLVTMIKNETDEYDRYYSRKSDLRLRINLALYFYFEKHRSINQIPESRHEILTRGLNELEAHLELRLKMLEELPASEKLQGTYNALNEVRQLRVKIKESLEKSTEYHKQKSEEAAVMEQRNFEMIAKLEKLKTLQQKGLISENEYQAEVEKIKRMAG